MLYEDAGHTLYVLAVEVVDRRACGAPRARAGWHNGSARVLRTSVLAGVARVADGSHLVLRHVEPHEPVVVARRDGWLLVPDKTHKSIAEARICERLKYRVGRGSAVVLLALTTRAAAIDARRREVAVTERLRGVLVEGALDPVARRVPEQEQAYPHGPWARTSRLKTGTN